MQYLQTKISSLLSSNYFVSTIFILLLIAIGFYIRLHNLSVVSASISKDELDHAINGLSILHTGKDFQGGRFFWELYPAETHTFTAELSALWHAVMPRLSSDPLVIARTPNAVFGLIFVAVFTIFSFQIFRSTLLALIVGLSLLLNPWHIYISRTAYEAPLALTWLVVSMAFFWQALERTTTIRFRIASTLGAAIALVASFYSYHGYKALFPFIYAVLFLWQMHRQGVLSAALASRSSAELVKRTWPLVLLLTLWLVLFATFFSRLSQGVYGSRLNEVAIFNSQLLGQEVDEKRRDSLDNSFTNIFVNKAVIAFDNTISNFAAAFNPKTLFTSGFDSSLVLGLWEHGFLYIVQIPLIVIGIYWLLKRSRRDAFYILLLVGASLLPVLIHVGTSITLRSSIYIPILVLLASLGIYFLIRAQYSRKIVLLIGLLAVIVLSIFRFQYFYFTRFPIATIDNAMFDGRLANTYVRLHQQTQSPITFVTMDPYNAARWFAYFSKSITPESIQK